MILYFYLESNYNLQENEKKGKITASKIMGCLKMSRSQVYKVGHVQRKLLTPSQTHVLYLGKYSEAQPIHSSFFPIHDTGWMGKLRSSSFCWLYPHFIISSIALCFMQRATIVVVLLFFDFRNVNGVEFDPLIQLPGSTSEYFRNSSTTNSSIVLLHINDFGAIGNGIQDDTKAFQKVWKIACSSLSEAKIVVPDGNTYLIRPIDFPGPCRSNLTLSISGTIVAPRDPDVWDGLDPNKWLYFHGVKNLTVEGGGKVDGRGQEWWARSCKINQTNPCRHAPKAMTFHRCKNLKVRNIMSSNSQQMHMAFSACKQIAISNLRIFAPAHSPNTDGIHISASTDVEINNSTIRTGDDCISIVSNSSKIRIGGITCGPGHGISIGSLGKSNSSDQVHDIKVNGALLSNTENGVRIKTWQGGSGFASRITFQNVLMQNVSNPIIIDQYYCDSFVPCANQTSAVSISKISYVGIKGTSATEEAVRFACSDSSPCRRLYLEDVRLTSYSGENTTSFCWEAFGSSSGLVYPPPCFSSSCDNRIIQQKTQSSSIQST